MLSRLFVPDTVDYMIAGYVVLTVVISIYLLSLYLRLKKTRQEVEKFTRTEK
jgi:hypothetical protein